MIAELKLWVAMLDAIGWEESGLEDEGDALISVDEGLAMWAWGQAVVVEHDFDNHFEPCDEDFEALAGLRLIAEAVA